MVGQVKIMNVVIRALQSVYLGKQIKNWYNNPK